MSALQRDSDLLWRACEGLNALEAGLKGRVAFRVANGAEATAAAIERVADLIAQAHAAALLLSHQFATDAALAARPVPMLSTISKPYHGASL